MIKGRMVWIAGSGKDIHVFEDEITASMWIKTNGKRCGLKEVEVGGTYVMCGEEYVSDNYAPHKTWSYPAYGRLSDIIADAESQLNEKKNRFKGADGEPVQGMWRWYLVEFKEGVCTRLWESDWVD